MAKKIVGTKEYQRLVAQRQVFSAFRAEPNFIIVGVQKGGTTSLFHYLAQHPDVATSFTKEAHFFNAAYDQGLAYYKAFFPFKWETKNKIVGESSPDYVENPLVPERIFRHYPNIKLIFIFRDPVERAYSHYQMTCSFGSDLETLPFERAIEAEPQRLAPIKKKMKEQPFYYDLKLCYYNYLEKGHYAEQLNNWLKYFNRNQMLILKSEELFQEPERIYAETEAFLGLKHHPLKSFKVYNSRTYDKIDPDTRSKLQAYFAPKNEAFYQLIGQRFWDN